MEEQNLSSLTAVGVDETSRRKGHSYITAFVDLHEKGAVFATPGKDAPTLEAFKDFLESHGGRSLSSEMSQKDQIRTAQSPCFLEVFLSLSGFR